MIGRLRGEVIDRTADGLVLDVNGVGYQVTVLRRGGYHIGDSADLFIHTHVREDALQLFGFLEADEREVFLMLITVPSIGPVKAMGIMEAPLIDLLASVVNGDTKRLAKLPGIGKRTSERMIVDLREKMAALASSVQETSSRPPMAAHGQNLDDLVSALNHLGFKANVAEREALAAIEKLGVDASFDILLRHSLDQLRRR